MLIEINRFVEAMSRATDFAEAEMLNILPYHEKRVGILAGRMGEYMGLDRETIYALTMAGALHDCALAEYLDDEFTESGGGHVKSELDMEPHCRAGERMIKNFPFYSLVKGAILHHHDRADGSGALGAKAEDTPMYGQILHIADGADARFSLYTMDPDKYRELMAWVEKNTGSIFSPECSRIFREALDYDIFDRIQGEGSIAMLEEMLPSMKVDISTSVLREISEILAHTTDYKSHFTWRHSLGIAEKAETLGHYYGYDQEKCDKLYIAGALHDIGKLLVPNDILEKPAKLTSEEYQTIQNHAMGTWKLLHPIGGMEDITRWAALHHEKLDGSGYPFGMTGDQLGHEERMMACLDIYQAMTEERPYKPGLTHEEAMRILYKMGRAGQLDEQIIEDINCCCGGYCTIPPEHSANTTATRGSGVPVTSGVDNSVTPEPGTTAQRWRCPVCGYIHEGSLPAGFICPRCEQPGSIFERD